MSQMIKCVWEHNGNDSLLYAANFPGAYTRGADRESAIRKMPSEIRSYLAWKGEPIPEYLGVEIVQEAVCDLNVCDADSDIMFDTEKLPLSLEEYASLKALCLRSADDFLRLYRSVPDRYRSCIPPRTTFYGEMPRTAEEMYRHVKCVNSYYFGEIDVQADNEGSISECRLRGFAALEKQSDYLANPIFAGSYGESWSLRKVLRRFLWHDRIHALAMYRMAQRTFGTGSIPDVFSFSLRSPL